MRRLIVLGTVAVLACAAGVGAASAQDRPDRSLRLDHDSMRNDYREDRLKIPAHPLFPEQAAPPTAASKGKDKSKRGGAASR